MTTTRNDLEEKLAGLEECRIDLLKNRRDADEHLVEARKVSLDCNIAITTGGGVNIAGTGMLFCPITALPGLVLCGVGSVTSFGTQVTKGFIMSRIERKAQHLLPNALRLAHEWHGIWLEIVEILTNFAPHLFHVGELLADAILHMGITGTTFAAAKAGVASISITKASASMGAAGTGIGKVAVAPLLIVGGVVSVVEVGCAWGIKDGTVKELEKIVKALDNELENLDDKINILKDALKLIPA